MSHESDPSDWSDRYGPPAVRYASRDAISSTPRPLSSPSGIRDQLCRVDQATASRGQTSELPPGWRKVSDFVLSFRKIPVRTSPDRAAITCVS